MTTDIKQLPLPSVLLNWPHPTNHVAIRDYARAVAEYNVKERDAEIERLRAIIDNREAIIATHAADTREYQKHLMHAEARAERLAEALRWYVENDDTNEGQEGNEYWLAGRDRAIAVLRDHDQETGNG